MKIIVCLDKNGGMLFNRRRQSRDARVFEDISTYAGCLAASPFSEKLLSAYGVSHTISEDLPESAGDGYCFVEDIPLLPYRESITEIIVYRWDKIYPADVTLDLPLSEFKLIATEELSGSSHNVILKEIYTK